MSPLFFLLLLVGLSLAAAGASVALRRRAGRNVRRLAAEWRMHYMPGDSLHVTPKIARNFPVPGAANLLVRDLVYGIERDRYRYVFTAEYTEGVVRTKRRVSRVGTFSEPRNRSQRQSVEESAVVLAPEGESIVEQYLSLAPKREASPGPGKVVGRAPGESDTRMRF